jgi:hypothetical protein
MRKAGYDYDKTVTLTALQPRIKATLFNNCIILIRHSREGGNPPIHKHWRRHGFPPSRE